MLIPFILVIVGLALLIYSADLLVKGSASISKKLGISSLVIGLTVVSFGTSAPELIVNILSAIQDNSGLSLGNIVGSNIANILLILGIGSMFYDLKVQNSTTYKEIPFAVLAALMIITMVNDSLIDNQSINIISRSDGIALIGFFIIFMYYVFSISKNSNNPTEDEEIEIYPILKSIIYTLAGMIGLFFGGKLLVDNAVTLATQLGVSDVLIGITIVAVGTSLPELVTTVIAAIKKQSDIAVGNVVGSCIFNIFWILGITSLISPINVKQSINFDLGISLLATVMLFFAIIINKNRTINKFSGSIFLVTYLVYTCLIIYRG